MPQYMRMNGNTAFLLQFVKNRFNAVYCQWPFFTNKHIFTFYQECATMLMNKLPERFAHVRMYPNLTLFLPLAMHLNLPLLNISQAQTAQLRNPNTRIQQQEQNHIVSISRARRLV